QSSMSAMRDFFKRFVPTSDPDNLRTPPLPLEELYKYSPQNSPLARESISPNSDTSSEFGGSPPYSVSSPEDASSPRSVGRNGVKRRSETISREFSRESSMDCPAKRTRAYKLKSDVQRRDEDYRRMRDQNNVAVRRTRERNKAKQEEEKKKSEEEKQLYKSTMMKMMEIHLSGEIMAEKQKEGLYIPPDTLQRANLGSMSVDEWSLHESMRRELEARLVMMARRM
ncbi:hypothetical protein PMAYCL1PPCAC_07705, partial [Pristionchus mayeri]